MSEIIIAPAGSKTVADALSQAFVKQENDYVERVLSTCEQYCPIKTFKVIRAKSFPELKEQVDAICDLNPDFELGDGITNMPEIGTDKYVAVLVHYDFEEKERRRLENNK